MRKASEIIEEIARSKEYKKLCRNIAGVGDLYEDLFQETLLALCENDPEKIERAEREGYLKWMVIKIASTQFKSPRSKFYKLYLSHKSKSCELNIDIKDEEYIVSNFSKVLDFIQDELSKEHFKSSSEWYENKLFEAYLREGTIRGLERKTGIYRKTITHTIECYIEKLKERMPEFLRHQNKDFSIY